ncbi:MAG: hypothetical protein ACI4U5_05270 [Bacilli bacterium]
MNRGFKFYFTEGIKKAVKTLFKRGNYLRFYIYSIMIFLLSIMGIFIPIAQLARVRLGRIIKEHEDFDLPKVFAPSDKPLTVWNTFMALLLKVVLFLGGLIIILLVAGIFFLIQLSLQLLIYGGIRNPIIFILFMIPPAILLIAYLIMYPIYLAPAMFCIDAIDKAKASETIYKSFYAVRISGKLQLFLNAICYYGPLIIYLVLTSALSTYLLKYGDNEMRSLALIFVIIFIAIFFVGAPILVIGCRVANTLLFEDIIIDRFNYENDVKGLFIKGTKSGKVDKTNYEDSLIRLFDETETASKEKDSKPLSKDEKRMIYKQRQQESKVIKPQIKENKEEGNFEIVREINDEEIIETSSTLTEKEDDLVKEDIKETIIEREEIYEDVLPSYEVEDSSIKEDEHVQVPEEEQSSLEINQTEEPLETEVAEEKQPFIFGNPFGDSLDDDEEEKELNDTNPFTNGKNIFGNFESDFNDEDEDEELIDVTPYKRKSNKNNEDDE